MTARSLHHDGIRTIAWLIAELVSSPRIVNWLISWSLAARQRGVGENYQVVRRRYRISFAQVRCVNPRVNTLMNTTSCRGTFFVNTCDVDQNSIRHCKAQLLAHQCGVRAVKSRQPVSPDNVGYFKLVDNDSNRAIAG